MAFPRTGCFLDFGLCFTFEIEERFFFFWSSRPMVGLIWGRVCGVVVGMVLELGSPWSGTVSRNILCAICDVCTKSWRVCRCFT